MFEVNNKDNRTTPMAPLSFFIVNFENISHLSTSIVNLEQVNADWVVTFVFCCFQEIQNGIIGNKWTSEKNFN